MSKEELLIRRINSMARSMEVEGADYENSKRAMLNVVRSRKHR